ncbi:MAG: AAA family ATPase [Minicystis sp.]
MLADLSHPAEKMEPGKTVRLYLDDIRKFPTIELPYGDVPVIHASAAMQRILGLSYLIVWAWTEHLTYCNLRGWEPARRFVLLMDEPEMHLHPKWQRVIAPKVIDTLRSLAPGMKPQVIFTTHSPMVLASIEPHFRSLKDKLFLFEMEGREVSLRELPWVKHGDVLGWLTSEVFGLEQARSIEAERAIDAAYAFMRGDTGSLPAGLDTAEAIHRELTRVLPDQDPFWPRWIFERWRREHP